jgi:hypothetical protein
MKILGSKALTQASSLSKTLPAGLARRDLELPPGIEKKLAAGGTAPQGIANRFPAETLISPPADTSNGGTTEPVSSVDISV